MVTQRHETTRPAEGAVESRRWVIALVLVGVAGSIGVGAQNTSSVAPVLASYGLLIAGGILLASGSRERLLHVSALLALGAVLTFSFSAVAAAMVATALALVGLVSGPKVLNGSRRAARGHIGSPSLHELLKSMAIASEIRDHQTADHCDRVSRNCRLLGVFLGLTEPEITGLEWAARVHDVGKAAIPRRILQKPGPLTSQEMEAVKDHSRLGADMLVAASDQLAHVARVVLHHHENWDGTGYPVGLSGIEIPLEARIIAVVDMYEALTSERPYRAAMTPQDAHDEVVARSGSRFDPDVIVVFDELWRRGQLDTWTLQHRNSVEPQSVHAHMQSSGNRLVLTRRENAQLTSI
jgi:HD-GYP domain-containing protein (c-di-GMP phosphodiesterase class II)